MSSALSSYYAFIFLRFKLKHNDVIIATGGVEVGVPSAIELPLVEPLSDLFVVRGLPEYPSLTALT